MLRYLAVLAVMVACFMGDMSAVTDQEFQELARLVHEIKKELKAEILAEIRAEIHDELRGEVRTFETVDFSRNSDKVLDIQPEGEIWQNNTIEERVALLEIQVTDLEQNVGDLDENVDFLFDEQVIQDERLFSLEQRVQSVEVNDDQVEDEIESLQNTLLALDFRVTVLEETGGGGGNSSASELEERVETLEGTATDHETRITSNEGDIEGLEGSSSDQETRLTAAEENIQGLQMTDINHDARITALEENGGGGGGSQNETIAFHTVLTSYTSIPDETNVEFNEILLNQGNGYDSTTGVFTVPSGGDGLYYFSTYLFVDDGEYGRFDMVLNDDVICTAQGDHNNNGASDFAQATCSAVVNVVEGDEVKVVLTDYTDDTPLQVFTSQYMNGFNGFRI